MTGCWLCTGPHDLPPAPGDDVRVSVVVSHYEQHDDLARTLAALARQDVALHEVVVTDDGSREPPVVPPGVGLVTQPDRGFRAALARNRGVAATTGDVVVLLDADTVPEPDAVRRLAAVAAHEPDVLVVGRRRHTDFAPGPLDPADPLRGALAHELEEPAWLADGWAATDDLRAADHGSFRYVISALLAGSRAWFDRVGGFDPSFEGYGGEDWDLAHRWYEAGGRLRHEPAAVAWHHGDHAGGATRREDPTSARRTGEAVAVARRIAAPPVGFRGLRAAPARLLVTHEPDLPDHELLASVDGLLRDVPQAEVVSDRPVWRDLPDQRVRPRPGSDARRASLLLHLHRGLLAEPGAWGALVGLDPDGATCLDVRLDDHVVATLTDLRALRRAHLGLAPTTRRDAPQPPGLHPASGVPLGAWLGGWWAG